MNTLCVIPVRYASQRLPGKALAEIAGKPMVQWVWESAMRAKVFRQVIIATDDERIQKKATHFGAEVMMTSPSHPSGTDRVAEVVRKVRGNPIVNLQGDEPLIQPYHLAQLVHQMEEDERIPMITLAAAVSEEEAHSPSCVKVVVNAKQDALYFSRAPIPYPYRSDTPEKTLYWKHIGVYGYRRRVLLRLVSYPPSPLEQMEKLEQLRALEHGISIRVIPISEPVISVDTEKDLRQVQEVIKTHG